MPQTQHWSATFALACLTTPHAKTTRTVLSLHPPMTAIKELTSAAPSSGERALMNQVGFTSFDWSNNMVLKFVSANVKAN